jgi:hypothetical protein
MNKLDPNKEIYRLEMLIQSFDNYIINLKEFLFSSSVSSEDGEKLLKEINRATQEKTDILNTYADFMKHEAPDEKPQDKSTVNSELNKKFAQFYNEDDYREWILKKKKQILEDIDKKALWNKDNIKNNL